MTKFDFTNKVNNIIQTKQFRIFVSITIAFAIASVVTIDQQSKNAIKLLVFLGFFVTIFNWKTLISHLKESDKSFYIIILLFYFSVIISTLFNPLNSDTLRELEILSISIGSLLIYNLLLIIRFPPNYFWWGITLCAISSGVYSLVELYLYGIAHRAAGSTNKPIMFGDIALVTGFMSIATTEYFKQLRSPLNTLPYVALLLGIIASILSQTRGSWLFLPFAIFLLFRNTRTNNVKFPIKKIMAILLVSILPIAMLSNGILTNRIDAAYKDIHSYFIKDATATNVTSLGTRFELWYAAIIAFKSSELVGIGPGSFKDHIKYLAKNKIIQSKQATINLSNGKLIPHSHAHNEYLNTLATRGIIGILTFLFLFVFYLRKFYTLSHAEDQETKDISIAGLFLLSGYLVFSLSDSVLSLHITNNFFYLSLTCMVYLVHTKNNHKHKKP